MKRKKNLFFILISIVILLITSNVVSSYKVNLIQHSSLTQPLQTNTINDNYNMIIITVSDYEPYLSSFIEHKNNIGVQTKLVSIYDIYNSVYFDVQGRDKPEKIKYFIKDAVEKWGIDYVLFVGGTKQVPVRECYNDDKYTKSPEPMFISELYYADIYDSEDHFSTWDSDDDGVFGEWKDEQAEDKNIDLKPDVCIGRLACTNIEEVKTVVNKIINYEKQTFTSWFNRIVVAGGDTYKKYEGFEGEIYNQQVLDVMDDFNPVKLWASNNGLTKNGWDILTELNKGCGFLYLSGHGNVNLWATYNADRENVGKFDKSMMNFLSNKNKLPVCLVGGCHNSEFSVFKSLIKTHFKILNNFNNLWGSNGCWSWELTRRADGGAIATLGTTGLCWYGIEYEGGGTNWLNLQFFKEYKKEIKVIGELWKNAISGFVDNYPIDWDTPAGGASSIDAKTAQQWTLLGDPSLMIGGLS
jgi:hypothetical protein